MSTPVSNLFALTARDGSSDFWQPQIYRDSLALALITVTTAPMPIPLGKIFWPSQIVVGGDPGLAQSTQLVEAVVQDSQGQDIGLLGRQGNGNDTPPADRTVNLTTSPVGVCLIGGVHFLVGRVRFDNNVAVNTVTVGFTGLITVRGNASR